MYSEKLIKLVQNIDDKRYMISLSLKKDIRIEIEEATRWLNVILKNPPLKIRCLAIRNNLHIGNYPKCEVCGNNVTYDKEYSNHFLDVCSSKCSREKCKLDVDIREKLNDKDWLYQKRIVERVSYADIGVLLGCSEYPVIKACESLCIPKIKLNESESSVKTLLMDKEFLKKEHVNNRKQLWKIAKDIGTSTATVSKYLNNHGLKANNSNSYQRIHNNVSKECKEVIEFIKSIIPYEIIVNDRSILNGREIDILIPSLKIGFEYNGIYSHIYSHKMGAINKEKDYHLKKTLDSKNNGITLFHIFSDDWILNKETVKGFISAKLGVFNKKIYARKCEVIKPDKTSKNIFMTANHLQGNDKSSISYGLKFEGEIVVMMTFCKSRYNKIALWELSRFAVKRGYLVIGGFSRLLNKFKNNYTGNIISYADRSYSDGGVYEKNGFKLIRTNPPGYKYVNLNLGIKRMHRANFMKKKIADEGDTRSEYEIMFAKGYRKIYDCGTLSYLI